MSQFDYGTINPTTKSGSTLASDLNSFRDALNSTHKGPAAPSYAVAGLYWIDDSGDPLWIKKVYDGANWIAVEAIDTTGNVSYPIGANPRQAFPIAGGTANALTLTPTVPLTAYADGDVVTFAGGADNTGAVTLDVSGVGAKAIRKIAAGADVALDGGDILAAWCYTAVYRAAANAAAGGWILVDAAKSILGNPWALQPIGVPIPVFDDVASPPPKGRWVLMTAGETGAGKFNNGILTSESVTGSAPLVVATAVVSLAGSAFDGKTINLINTERRFLRAGMSGTVESDTVQGHWHKLGNLATGVPDYTRGITASGGSGASAGTGGTADTLDGAIDLVSDGTNGTPRVSNETRPKNIGANFYMRLK